MVYGYLLHQSQGFCIMWHRMPFHWNSYYYRIRQISSVFSVCRQVNAEVMPIFYGCNTFTMSSSRVCEVFLHFIGSNRLHLRKVVLCNNFKTYLPRACRLLSEATNLQVLHFDDSTWSLGRQFNVNPLLPLTAVELARLFRPVFAAIYRREADWNKVFATVVLNGCKCRDQFTTNECRCQRQKFLTKFQERIIAEVTSMPI